MDVEQDQLQAVCMRLSCIGERARSLLTVSTCTALCFLTCFIGSTPLSTMSTPICTPQLLIPGPTCCEACDVANGLTRAPYSLPSGHTCTSWCRVFGNTCRQTSSLLGVACTPSVLYVCIYVELPISICVPTAFTPVSLCAPPCHLHPFSLRLCLPCPPLRLSPLFPLWC